MEGVMRPLSRLTPPAAIIPRVWLIRFPGSPARTFGLERLVGALHFTDQPDPELWVRRSRYVPISLHPRLMFQHPAPMSIPQ